MSLLQRERRALRRPRPLYGAEVMRAAIYLRVSTDEQQHANQLPECDRLCAARGWDPVLVVENESGVKERPGWAHVLELARTGQIGAVVIWALDRAGRTRVQVA